VSDLTPHQARVLAEVLHVTRSGHVAVTATQRRNRYGAKQVFDPDCAGSEYETRWATCWAVGSPAALEHLADKGYLRRIEGHGGRSTFFAYRPTMKARATQAGAPT
jgi:hypothetical protein